MEDCIFCKIAEGVLPSTKIYEDEIFLAFMDINPLGPGHCLLIPKAHYEDIFSIPEDVIKELAAVNKKLAQAVKDGMKADGIFHFQANGRAATQMVPHYHQHILPRFENDNITIGSWELTPGNMDEIQAAAERITGAL